MQEIKNIVLSEVVRRNISVVLMLFLLGFLTVGNFFVYGDQTIAGVVHGSTSAGDMDDSDKFPITTDEEKPGSSKSSSGNSLAEEYLHERDLFLHLYASLLKNPSGDYIHTHGFGYDHSSLHCPPPDHTLS